MFTDRRIKAHIKSLKTPKTSFADFCEANDIELRKPQQKRCAEKRKFVFPVAVSFILFVGVCLAILLPINIIKSNDIEKYQENDVTRLPASKEQIMADKDIILFNVGKAEDIGQIFSIVSKQDKNCTLGSTFKNVIYGGMVGGKIYAYQFNYLVRYNKNYDFKGSELYLGTNIIVEYNDVTFKYNINENDIKPRAYITFAKGKYDYFIEVSTFNNMTELNNANIETYIELLFETDR